MKFSLTLSLPIYIVLSNMVYTRANGNINSSLGKDNIDEKPYAKETFTTSFTNTNSKYSSSLVTKSNNEAPSPRIFPNPSSNGIFTIENHETCQVKVYNNLGQIIYRKNLILPINSIDISAHAKDAYTIAIETDKRIYVTSLIYK